MSCKKILVSEQKRFHDDTYLTVVRVYKLTYSVNQIKELYNSGESIQKICKKLGYTKNAVSEIVKGIRSQKTDG